MEIGTTVGVVGICHGYPEHLTGWLESVRSLNRKPDKIVLVLYAEIDKSNYDLEGVRVLPWWDDFAFSDMLNLGFEYCDTDWISWIGIDDRYRPHALDKLDSCEADVLALGFEYDTGQIWTPANVTAEQILSLQANMIPCGSPVRRELWNEHPFDQRISPYEDWCFWIGTAVAGATYESTLNIDVDYAYAGHFVPCDVKARSTAAQYLQDTMALRASRIDKT